MANISFWENDSFFAHTDVLIVGAGLMGLWTAYELEKKQSALKVTIIEKHSTPLGASTRNAGFACFGSATELLADVVAYGENDMLQTVEMRYKGITKIRSIFSDNQIAYDNCGGFECLYETDQLAEKLNYVNKLLQAITNKHSTFEVASFQLKNLQIKGFNTLVSNTLEGGLHSGKLVQSLSQKVQQMGVQILYGIDLDNWDENNNRIQVYTKQNITFTTNQLVFCTNAFTHLFFPDLQTEPARGQIIVTAPIENLALKGTFHFDEGFYYWRNVGNRILLGGGRNIAFEEEKTTSLNASIKIQEHLEAFLYRHLLSENVSIEYRWSGLMAFTNNKKPLIANPKKNVFAAIACNGMGVALTPIMAEKLAAMLV